MFVTIIVPVHLKTLLSKLLSVKSYQQRKIKKRATAHFCVVAFLNATRTIAEKVGIDITEDVSYNNVANLIGIISGSILIGLVSLYYHKKGLK